MRYAHATRRFKGPLAAVCVCVCVHIRLPCCKLGLSCWNTLGKYKKCADTADDAAAAPDVGHA